MPTATLARDDLATANLRLAIYAASLFWRRLPLPTRRRYSCEDAVQDASLGLLRAAALFDESKGAKFSTFAMLLMRQAMTRASEVGAPRPPVRDPSKFACPKSATSNLYTLPDHRHSETPESREESEAMADLLRRMPRRDREMVEARLAGEGFKSIGARYGISWNRVQQVVTRCVRKMKKALERGVVV